MNQSLFKISDSEMQRRQDFDKEFEQQKALLEQAKKNNPAAATEIDNELKNLQAKKDKDDKRREKQQTSVFSKGFKGIQNSFKGFTKSIADKGGAVAKSGLLIAAYFAFANLLQSEALMDFIKFFSKS
jgi:recombination DNA repair RAD52 pathway protein